MNRIIWIALAVVTFNSCKTKDQKVATNQVDILAASLDTTVSPGEDFFQYANGGWIKSTIIPASESSWGIGQMVQEDIYNKLKKINEEAAQKQNAAGTIDQKIGDFWKTGMDSVAIDNAGWAPLKDYFAAIDNIKDIKDFEKEVAQLHRKGIHPAFNMYVAQDDKKSDEMAVQFSQGGLGMPNRDYYFNNDERTKGIRENYKAYIQKVFTKLDSANAKKTATAVFDLQTKLAGGSKKLADLRDPYANYHKMSWAQLQKLAPNFDWADYAATTTANKVDSVIVGQPEFYTTFNSILTPANLTTLKSYLKLRVVQSLSPYLDKNSFQDFFDYTKSFSGATEPRERWKRVLDAEEDAMGEALGQLFVKEYFSPQAKERYNTIVENIREAYKERIKKLDWMSDSTKTKALYKLSKITQKVGYPDKWKDFSSLKIDEGPWVLNVQRADEWWFNYNMDKLGKPVDRTEWSMTPQTYNAYYNPSNNEIVLPAGIFSVPGYKDAELDDAVVYGYAAASTIGHEITHGFDDQGRQYDAEGNLKNWWTKNDEIEFSKRADMIIRQFNAYTPVDTFHINGRATQGENIADLGGMILGLDAFKKTDAYKSNKVIGGLTQLQRYFLGYALGWKYTQRKENLASRLMTDVHSPAKERVNGPVVNMPEFYEAFHIKQGDKMYRPDSLRVKIW